VSKILYLHKGYGIVMDENIKNRAVITGEKMKIIIQIGSEVHNEMTETVNNKWGHKNKKHFENGNKLVCHRAS